MNLGYHKTVFKWLLLSFSRTVLEAAGAYATIVIHPEIIFQVKLNSLSNIKYICGGNRMNAKELSVLSEPPCKWLSN